MWSREGILAVSGFRETLSPLAVRKKGWMCIRDFWEQDRRKSGK